MTPWERRAGLRRMLVGTHCLLDVLGLDHSSDEHLVNWMNEFKESAFAKNSKR